MRKFTVVLGCRGEVVISETNIRTITGECAYLLARQVEQTGHTGFSASFFGNSYVAGASLHEGIIFSLADRISHALRPAFAHVRQETGKEIGLECIDGALPGHNSARTMCKLLDASHPVTPEAVSHFIRNDAQVDPNFRGLQFHRHLVPYKGQSFTDLLAPRPSWLQTTYVCLGAGEPLDYLLRGGLSQAWRARTIATRNELVACQQFLCRLQEINSRLRLIQLAIPGKLLASWPIRGHLQKVNQLFAAANALPLQMWEQKWLYRGRGLFGVDVHPDEFGYQLLVLQAIDAFSKSLFKQSIKKIPPKWALVNDCQLHQKLTISFFNSYEETKKRSTPEFWQAQFEQLRHWFAGLKKSSQHNEAAAIVRNWEHHRYSDYWYHNSQIYQLFAEFIEFLREHLNNHH